MAGNEVLEHLNFTPSEVEHNVNIARQVGRIIGGGLAYAISPDERHGYDRLSDKLPDWSVVLVTPGGPLKLERNQWSGPTIGLLYPNAAYPLDEEIVTGIFGAEAAELHTVFHPERDGSEDYTRLTGTFRLPEVDTEGRHFWLEPEEPRFASLGQIAVINSKVGELELNPETTHNISLHKGRYRGVTLPLN